MRIAALSLALVCIGFAQGAKLTQKFKMMSQIKNKLATKVSILSLVKLASSSLQHQLHGVR